MKIRFYFFLAFVLLIITIPFIDKIFLLGKITPTVLSEVSTNEDSFVNQSISTSTTSTFTKVNSVLQKVFKLDVPYFHQQYNNSCEASSLRMALAYYGIEISNDLEIVKRFGYKPRQKDVENNEWDDPREMFVGDIDIVGGTEGYGVYGPPVVKTAISYGRDASYKTDINAEFLASEIKEGHPIILWGYTSITAPAYTWNLPNGGEIKAFKGEHARLVVGFDGEVDNPTGFYLHDPFNGKKFEYWNTEKLINHTYAVPGVTNQAVVVK